MGTSISQILTVVTPPLGVTPGPATGLTVSNLSTNALTLSWAPPVTGSTPFTYQVQVLSGGLITNVGGSTSATSAGITSLTPNTSYTFSVLTSNTTGNSLSLPVATTTLSIAPGAPTGVAVVGTPTQTSISLQWNAPATGTAPFTYQIQSRTPTGTGVFTVAGTTAGTTQTIFGLAAGTGYDFQIIAANLAGAGSPSAILTNVQTAGGVTGNAPGLATGLTISNLATTSLTLSWTAPTTGTTPFSYQPQIAPAGPTPAWVNIGLPIAATSVGATALTPNTGYQFQVVTSNAVGTSISATTSTTTLAVLPGAVFGLAVTGTPTQTSISLVWAAPASGTPPFTYQVSSRTPSGSGSFTFAAAATASLTQAITGLLPSTGYDFEVSATNLAGAGPQSAILVNAQTAPGTIGNAPGPATGLAVSGLAPTSLTLSWVAPSTGTTPFSYQPQIAPAGASPVWTNVGGSTASLTVGVTGLTPNTAYQFQVVTSNAIGSSTSASLGATTLSVAPSPPTGLAVVGSPTQTSITIQWVAPAIGTPPFNYQVQSRVSGGGTFAVAGTTAALTLAVAGLLAGTSYDFEVFAANGGGVSAASVFLTGVFTATATAVIPSAPTNLTAGVVTTTTIPVTWTAPATGTPPLSYVVQYRLH